MMNLLISSQSARPPVASARLAPLPRPTQVPSTPVRRRPLCSWDRSSQWGFPTSWRRSTCCPTSCSRPRRCRRCRAGESSRDGVSPCCCDGKLRNASRPRHIMTKQKRKTEFLSGTHEPPPPTPRLVGVSSLSCWLCLWPWRRTVVPLEFVPKGSQQLNSALVSPLVSRDLDLWSCFSFLSWGLTSGQNNADIWKTRFFFKPWTFLQGSLHCLFTHSSLILHCLYVCELFNVFFIRYIQSLMEILEFLDKNPDDFKVLGE